MVTHRPEQKRFTIPTPSGTGFISYEEPDSTTMDFQHTVIPEADRGQGYGERLVNGAVAEARRLGKRVIPTCPFVKAWLDKQPSGQTPRA